MQNNRIRLVRLSEEHTIAFKEEMQEAFQHGFEAYNKDAEETAQLVNNVFNSPIFLIIKSPYMARLASRQDFLTKLNNAAF